jgi:diguanylate cyclase
MPNNAREEGHFDQRIAELLADPQYEGHPLQQALAELFSRYSDQVTQLERLTSISDGYQSVLHARNQSLSTRYRKQMRQLEKIVRISDHYQKMMRELNEALKTASMQDPLTELPNRRFMAERLEAETALSQRQNSVFSLAVIDIDFFKTINDAWGHDVGDKTLICIAQAIANSLRTYDICARWGGEEFMVLLPQTTGPQALEIANRLRVSIGKLCDQSLPSGDSVSISVGLAEHSPGTALSDTMKRADLALYEAKNTGRNRAILAPQTLDTD